MEYMLQTQINWHNYVKNMYNSHPAPPRLQVIIEKTASLYRLHTLVYSFRINQLNMSVTEHTFQKFTNLKYLNRLNIDIYW